MTYYIDYTNGNNLNDGLTQKTAKASFLQLIENGNLDFKIVILSSKDKKTFKVSNYLNITKQ